MANGVHPNTKYMKRQSYILNKSPTELDLKISEQFGNKQLQDPTEKLFAFIYDITIY